MHACNIIYYKNTLAHLTHARQMRACLKSRSRDSNIYGRHIMIYYIKTCHICAHYACMDRYIADAHI